MGTTNQAAINSFFAKRSPKKADSEGVEKNQEKKEDKESNDKVEEGPPAKKAKVEKNGGIPEMDDKAIPYKAVTDVFEQCEDTTKRLEISKYCGDFFLQVLQKHPHDLPKVVYLFTNRLGPDYEGLELGLGESLIMKALGEATGRKLDQIKQDYSEIGDLGKVAVKSRASQPTMFKPKPLDIHTVFSNLTKIAKTTGHASQKEKIGLITRMLTACKGTEAKYLTRSLEGKLRIGVQERTVLIALSQAFVKWEAEQEGKSYNSQQISKGEELLSEAHCQLPNYEIIINMCLEHGLQNILEHCKITPGIPLKPMLAKPTNSVKDVLERFSGERFTCEYKYDGERAQVHCNEDGEFKVFSRNMEDMSQRYPDIVSAGPKLKSSKGVTSFVMDCEAVAWDREQQQILSFQVLSTRKRKDVKEEDIKVRVCLFAFDLLYLNGEPLLKKTLEARRQMLHDHFGEVQDSFKFATAMDSNEIDDIQVFLDKSIEDKCEGLMVKTLDKDSEYEPSKRSRNWLKLKKDYMDGVGDSVDLVVLGGYYGKGRRTGRYGGYLLGCYNPDAEEYETVCKIGTGFSDSDLESLHSSLKDLVLDKKKSYVAHDDSGPNQPDCWFEPQVVWEIKAADLSLSPVYRAGINELGNGVSLRFPRFIRIRDDKTAEEATTSEQVVDLYRKQEGK